jgi:hypothetical protein
VCAYSGSQLVGYSSIVRADSPHIGLQRAYVADIFVENDDPHVIRQLLHASAQQARTDGAAMIEVVGFPAHIRQLLQQYRPFTLINPCWPFLYRAPDSQLHHALEDSALWHASLFDGDGSI